LIYFKELSEKIIGLAIDVHKELGNGFLEKIYENALVWELKNNNIKANQQHPISVVYKKEIVGEYFADILLEDKIILELKVTKKLKLFMKLNYCII